MTEAEKSIEKSKTHISEAIKELSKVVIDQAPGEKELSKSYTHKLAIRLQSLILIHNDLGEHHNG